jgi:hypothetical protein
LSSAYGQQPGAREEPFGLIVSRVGSKIQATERFMLKSGKTYGFLARASFFDAKGAHGAGVGFAYFDGGNPRHWWQLHAGYASSQAEDGSTSGETYALSGKYVLWLTDSALLQNGKPVYSLMGFVDGARQKGVANNYDAILDFSYETFANKPHFKGIFTDVNVGWGINHPDSSSATDDFLWGVGIGVKVSDSIQVSLDYVGRSDLSGEDDYSLTFSGGVNDFTVLRFYVAKHGTIAAQVVFSF